MLKCTSLIRRSTLIKIKGLLYNEMFGEHSCVWATAFLVLFSSSKCFGSEIEDATALPLKSIKWMHIQKTSSWIGDFLLLYACPHLRPIYDQMSDQVFFYDQVRAHTDMLKDCEVQVTHGHDGDFGWHDPYVPSQVGNGTTVSVFRKPEYRLISSFLFNMMIPTGNVYSYNNTLPEYVRNSAHPLIAYASVPGMSSCQIKMVLGRYCGTMVPELTRSDIEKAKHTVKHEFAFVGLTEESVATANLFYAMYGYRGYVPYLQPATKQFRTYGPRSSDSREDLLDQLKAHNWADPPEQELYQFVRELFYERCLQYNVPTVHSHLVSHTEAVTTD